MRKKHQSSTRKIARRRLAALIAAIACVFALLGTRTPAKGPQPLSVRITSPMGRLGVPGTVRIVAQIKADPEAVLSPVQF